MIPKFRAWWVEQEVMYDVDVIGFSEGAITVSNENTTYQHLGLNEVELMQSTDLKDKNGVEIYEGDIVKIKQQDPIDKYIPNNSNNEIVYKDSAFCVKETWKISDIQWPIVAGLYYKVSEEFEVIGNIYENPELLEVSE